MFAYNRFWLRFANQPFSLDRLDVYEKHFTVMNYSDAELQQMFCQDFVRLFEEQNPGILWEEVRSPSATTSLSATTSSSSSSPQVEKSIFLMLRGVFEGATALPPPQGIAACPQVARLHAGV